MFSCKNWKTKKVEFREKAMHLMNCTFKVSEAGRQRVLKEQRKNVHAGVLGNLLYLGRSGESLEDYTELTYDPYKFSSFVIKETEQPIESAKHVILVDKKVYAKGVKYV